MKLQTILVPLDFSDVSARVVELALQMAQSFGGRVVLLHVTAPEPDFVGYDAGPAAVRSTTAQEIRTEHHQLDGFKQQLAGAGVEVLALHLQGAFAEKVLAEAAKQNADLIVMGSHGHGALYQLLVGSVVADVVKEAPCPILLVPALGAAA